MSIKKICLNENCKKEFKVFEKNDLSLEKYNYCGDCRKCKKNCEVCNILIFKQGRSCSKICADELRKRTWLITQGTEHMFSKNSKTKIKIEKNLKENFNVENVFQIDYVKEKIKKTNLEKYGVDHPSKSEFFKNKKKETFFKNYGVKSIFEIKNYKNTGISYLEYFNNYMLSKYGVKRIYRPNLEKFYKTIRSEEHKQKMISLGYWLDDSKRTLKQIYYNEVKRHSKNSLKLYGKNKFGEMFEKSMSRTGLTLDHSFSQIKGFRKNIDPKIIGHICNLELMPFLQNIKKNTRCFIELEQLLINIEEFENENKKNIENKS